MGHGFRDIGIHVVFLVVRVVLFALSFYVLSLLWWSRRLVLRLDRDNYYICDKHGAIRESDMLTLTEFGEQHPIKMCPVCYTERMKDARAKAFASTEARNQN
jgi:hypothetical protein